MTADSTADAAASPRITSLAWTFGWVLAAVLAVAAIASAVAWRAAVEQRVDELRESRFGFALVTVRAALESGLMLGFAPEDLPGAQTLIEQTQARQPDILSIEVFDPRGRILFSTDPGGSGATVPAAWRGACLQRSDAPRRADDEDGRLQCVALVNAYEQVTAGVLLRYRSWASERADRGRADSFVPSVLTALAGLGGLAGLGAALGWLLARPHEQRLRSVVAALRPGASAEVRRASDPTLADASLGAASLAGPVAAGLATLDRMESTLDRLDAEADTIDRMEAS